MILLAHFIASIFLATALFPYFGAYSLLVFVGGFLIDLDHVVFFYMKFRQINPLKMYIYFRQIGKKKKFKTYEQVFRPFHTIEIAVLMMVSSFFSQTMLIIAAGYFVHMLMDYSYELYIFKTIRNFSAILYLSGKK